MSASNHLNRSATDIRDDIEYTKGLIDSLDENHADYPARKQKLEGDLNELDFLLSVGDTPLSNNEHGGNSFDFPALAASENTLQIPQRWPQPRRPNTSAANSGFNNGFAAYAGGSQNGFGGHFASNGVVARAGETTPWSFPPVGNLNNQPPSAAQPAVAFTGTSSSSTSSPYQSMSSSPPALPPAISQGRKRPRESLDIPPIAVNHVAKSMRTSPSPALTGSTTPSSFSSFDMPEDPEFFRLMGGNPKDHLRDLREEQKEQERILRQKREQERQDEAFARQLELQDSNHHPLPSQASTSVYGRDIRSTQPYSQALLDANGRFRRPDPPPFPPIFPTHEGTELSSHGRLGGPSNTPSTSNLEPVPVAKGDPFNYVDLGSDDDSEEDTGHPSSDLIEIDPASFHSSTRKRADRNHFSSTVLDENGSTRTNGLASPWTNANQAPSTDSNPWGAQSATPFGRHQGPMDYVGTNPYNASQINSNPTSSSIWQDAAGRIRQGFDATRDMSNAAYSYLDQQIRGISNGTTGYGSSYGYGAGPSGGDHLLGADLYNPYRNSATDPLDLGFSMNPALQHHYDYLSNDPTRTKEEIKSLLENIRPDEDLPPQNREGTPEAMMYPLMEHQKLGLAWMKNMEEGSNKGGILADDMGLGKTIQALALMVSRKSSDQNRKTTLIVAPVALLKQWEKEIQRKLRPGDTHRLSVYIVHGQKRQTTWNCLKRFDVVLTTYGTLATELKRKEDVDKAKRANPNWRPTSAADELPILGNDCKWYRVILDEAQCIKNKNTKQAKAAFELQALTRFCMSGTPMMNNVDELFSLIHFLRIKPYNVHENFRRSFSNPLKGQSESAKDTAMRKLQALLKAILLRRTKKSEIDGKPILQLPERTTEAVHGVFSQDEDAFYRALESKTQLVFNKYLRQGTVGRNYSNILVLLLRLRQACCHPHLIKNFGVREGGVTEVSAEDMIALAKKLSPEVVVRIKNDVRENNALECPICMDSAGNATIFTPCGHSTCSECFAKISDPSQAIQEGHGMEGDNVSVKCPNCRGKVNPSKVLDFKSFQKVHLPELGPDGTTADESEEDDESTSDSDSDEDDQDDESSDLDGFVVNDDAEDSESEDEDAEGYRKGKTPFEKSIKGSKRKGKKLKGKGKAKTEVSSRNTFAQFQKKPGASKKAHRKHLRRLARDWQTSGKIEKTLEILETIQQRKEGEKTIIFSQFTSLLDLLEVPIIENQWGYRRYDGSMTAGARNDAVNDFTEKANCNIMLISLKAGNAGLNLTAASQVIIFDPFWNPYIEEQAIDRAHRIGQHRPVEVHKLLIPNTVEDRIVALQERKRKLIEGALDEKASRNIGRLGERELAFLFGVSH